MSTPPASPLPQSWDFDAEFLSTPAYLPPYVRSYECPILGPSCRPTAAHVATWLPLSARDGLPPKATDHSVSLPLVHAIIDDRAHNRYRVHGPASLVLPEAHVDRHLLLVGPPGSGKTTQGIQPLVAQLIGDRSRSVVVFDPKCDQFALIQALAQRAGRSPRSVVRLNLSDPKSSVGWNPLHPSLSKSEAGSIASSLVMAVEGDHSHDSPFWRNNSIDLCAAVLLGLAQDVEETITLPRLQEILALPRKELIAWLSAHGAHKFVSYLSSGSHNAETILADAQMRLLWSTDLDLCAVLSHNELRLEDLFARPMVLVIEMDETRLEMQKPIFNLLVQQILDRGIQAAGRRPDSRLAFPVSVVIDEFGSALGAIPRFPRILNTLRSRRISVVAAVQSIAQIHALYKSDAGAVLCGFSSKWFFPNVELSDAEFASALCGTMTVCLPRSGDQPFTFMSRRVFLPEEIRRPMEHPVLGRPVTMLLADSIAMQCYLTPSYRHPNLQEALRVQQRRGRRHRRRKPLVYRPNTAPGSVPYAFIDTRAMSIGKIVDALVDLERKAGLLSSPPSMQQLWAQWRIREVLSLSQRVRFVEELLARHQTFDSLAEALSECKVKQPKLALAYLDYFVLREQLEPRATG